MARSIKRARIHVSRKASSKPLWQRMRDFRISRNAKMYREREVMHRRIAENGERRLADLLKRWGW